MSLMASLRRSARQASRKSQSRSLRVSAKRPRIAHGKVIVIGAGPAGLACAQHLAKHGADVVVVEARDRIGGRIHTATVGTDTIDLGAAFVHGSNRYNSVWNYAQQSGLADDLVTRGGGYAQGWSDSCPWYKPDGTRAERRKVGPTTGGTRWH